MYKAMYGDLFQIEARLSQKNACLSQILFLDTLTRALSYLLSAQFKTAQNIPVLVSTTDRKPNYVEMRRTYA